VSSAATKNKGASPLGEKRSLGLLQDDMDLRRAADLRTVWVKRGESVFGYEMAFLQDRKDPGQARAPADHPEKKEATAASRARLNSRIEEKGKFGNINFPRYDGALRYHTLQKSFVD